MKQQTFIKALPLVAALAIMSVGAPVSAQQVVKIGHVGPLTGAIAHLGKDNENGARMAIEDLNAKVEDQALWNDPKAAQEVMRERRRLEEAINATKSIEQERDDTVELLEMAEEEGCTLGDMAEAFVVAEQVFDIPALWRAIS